MHTSPINLLIDRHPFNGSALIRGSFGDKKLDLAIDRGAVNGDAHVHGHSGQDRIDITFGRDANDGYNSIRGNLGTRSVNGVIKRRQPDGDTLLTINDRQLDIDRRRFGEKVELKGTNISGTIDRNLREGDESAHFDTAHGTLDFTIDRDLLSGGFEIAGREDDEAFKMSAERAPADGDLKMSGTLPESFGLFPLLWEILGDDKNVPDNNPFYPGSLAGMSVQVQESLSHTAAH